MKFQIYFLFLIVYFPLIQSKTFPSYTHLMETRNLKVVPFYGYPPMLILWSQGKNVMPFTTIKKDIGHRKTDCKSKREILLLMANPEKLIKEFEAIFTETKCLDR